MGIFGYKNIHLETILDLKKAQVNLRLANDVFD